MQYGASSILAYIVAARDKREAHAEDIWLSVQSRADPDQHYTEQDIVAARDKRRPMPRIYDLACSLKPVNITTSRASR